MTRIALISIVTLSFGLGCPFGAVAQPGNTPPERWQAVDKSMTDLLLEGYRPVSVIAPNSHLRIYFLSSGSFLAKCTEEATLARLPPPPSQVPPAQQPSLPPLAAPGQRPASTQLPPLAQGAAASGPGNFMPEIQVNFECSRLSR
jgi:hypothetical protein